jgi:hypothetical protein
MKLHQVGLAPKSVAYQEISARVDLCGSAT